MINQNQIIENLTYHDQLTGLYNRKYFLDVLNYYDIPGILPISVIMGDINGLSIINNSMGYATVEEIIMKVTALLRKIVRKNDALTSDQTYRFAMSEEVALKEVVRCSGFQFDPQIVEVFVNMIHEK